MLVFCPFLFIPASLFSLFLSSQREDAALPARPEHSHPRGDRRGDGWPDQGNAAPEFTTMKACLPAGGEHFETIA